MPARQPGFGASRSPRSPIRRLDRRHEGKFGCHLLTFPGEGQFQGAGERIEPGPEPEDEFFVIAVTGAAPEAAQVHAGEVVLGLDRQSLPFLAVVLAVDPPPGPHTEMDAPVSGLRDQAVELYGGAVDLGQGSRDVEVIPGPVSVLRGVKHAGPAGGEAAGRMLPGERGAQPGELVRQLAGAVKAARWADLRRPGEGMGEGMGARVRDALLLALTALGEPKVDEPEGPPHQLALGRASWRRRRLAYPHWRALRGQEASR